MEGISYIAGTELPVVLIDVMRGGPGLGNIAPHKAIITRSFMEAVTAIISPLCWRPPACKKPSISP
ncbi:MAG: hypothetical protein M5U05_16490 [Anaerolineales bacterium]|nr:hypothetical protein [Anaerolineales bacterium]